MGQTASFHAPQGGVFLGLRQGRSGATEIVYDDGVARRLIWRVSSAGSRAEEIGEALEVSVATVDRDLRFARAWLKEALSP